MFILKAATYSCICSMINLLNSNWGNFFRRNRAGIFLISASSPTHKSEFIFLARLLYLSMITFVRPFILIILYFLGISSHVRALYLLAHLVYTMGNLFLPKHPCRQLRDNHMVLR